MPMLVAVAKVDGAVVGQGLSARDWVIAGIVLIGALGIGGLALALAAQAILANFLGSTILQVRRPFRRGDQILTGSSEGTVVDVNFRTVVLRTFDGERVCVPCTEVLNNPIVNHTALGRRRPTLTIGVGYDSDLEEARTVLSAAVKSVDGVLDQPPPEVWVKGLGESSVELVLRFWDAPDSATLWRVRSGAAVAAKQALDEAGIRLPFPQRTIHLADFSPEAAGGPRGELSHFDR